jgi:serine protease Do
MEVLQAEEQAVVGIARSVGPAVVHVEALIDEPAAGGAAPGGGQPLFPFGPDFQSPQPRSRRGMASGSGIIVSPDGIVITNRHVVENSKRVIITLSDHRRFSGTVYSDPNIDLAVVKIDGTNLPFAHLADTNNLHIGQWAIAIGYPFDVGQTVTKGIISALGRSQTIEGKFYPDLIQTDASINPGNSGGALVDINGNVIGINTAIAGEAAQSAGIGFAIPASTVKLVYPQLANAPHLITNYPRGWRRGKLGVSVEPITPNLAKVLGVDEGALVGEVQPNSPAAKAGIEVGDVITKVNETPIRDAEELVDAVSNVGPNQSAVISLLRDKKPTTRTVITASFTSDTATTGTQSGKHVGLSVTTLTPDMRGELKLPDNVRDGAVVTAVQAGSPAEDAAFQQGDLIYQVNETRIHNAEDFSAAIAAAKPGDTVGVKVYRGDTPHYVELEIPDTTKQ